MLDDLSDQAVASRFFGGQPEVAPGVLLDPLEGLSGLLRELAVQPVAHLENLARLDLDVAGGPAGAARRLVQQEARVREAVRSEEHTSELQSQSNLVCRLLLEKKKK